MVTVEGAGVEAEMAAETIAAIIKCSSNKFNNSSRIITLTVAMSIIITNDNRRGLRSNSKLEMMRCELCWGD